MVKVVIEIIHTVEQKSELLLKEMKIGVAQRRVGKHERKYDAHSKHYSTRLLLIDEILQRHYKPMVDCFLIMFYHIDFSVFRHIFRRMRQRNGCVTKLSVPAKLHKKFCSRNPFIHNA